MSYITKQSELVLNCLKENREKHLTAENVYFKLKEMGLAVGKTTVYRHLEKLYAEGVIRKFFGGDGQGACFQYSPNDENCNSHYHLKCTCCSELFHTECDFLNELSEHIYNDHKFNLDSSKTVLYGTCENCLKKKKELKGRE